MKLGITMLIHGKDDIQFVTEFPCFLGHPVLFQPVKAKKGHTLAKLELLHFIQDLSYFKLLILKLILKQQRFKPLGCIDIGISILVCGKDQNP